MAGFHGQHRTSASLLAGLLALGLAACGGSATPEERVLLERQRFSVSLTSWAPVAGGRLALDVEVEVTGRSELTWLTVEVHQVGPGEEVLSREPVALDVAAMAFDGRKSLTLSVPSAGEAVQAVAVVLDPAPEEGERAAYREFAGS